MTQRILTGSYSGGYSLGSAYDQLTITSTGSVGGTGVTVDNGQSAAVLNQGRVTGGMTLADGGAVANAAYIGSTAVVSSATTTGTGYYGRAIYTASSMSSWSTTVEVDGAGSVNNHSVITNGVSIGGAGRVSNSGDIGSPGSDSSDLYTYGGATYFTSSTRASTAAVVLGDGGLVLNSGSINGVVIGGAAGTILNQGVISGVYSTSRFVTTENGYGRGGDRTNATVGTTAAVTLGYGGLVSNGSATNTAAMIDGIVATGAPATVVNEGVIGDSSSYREYRTRRNGYGRHRMAPSVSLAAGGSVTNGAPAHQAADISAGIVISGAAGTVANFATIGAGGYSSSEGPDRTLAYASVVLEDGGSVTNGSPGDSAAYMSSQVSVSSGTVTNYGVIGDGIQSHYSGGRALVSVSLAAGALVNGSAGDSAALIVNGVTLGPYSTITNFGTIEEASGKGAARVTFGEASDRLIEEGSGVLAARVYGDGGTLELAAGAGSGSLTGLGFDLIDFALVEVDAGAGWRLYGKSQIIAGETLTNAAAVADEATLLDSGLISTSADLVLATDARLTVAATGSIRLGGAFGITDLAGASATTLVNHGQISRLAGAGTSNLGVTDIVNEGTITAGAGVMSVAGEVTGVGAWQVAAGSTLTFAGAVSAKQTVTLAGAGSDLELTGGSAFAAAIAGFGSGAVIDLRGLAYRSQDVLSWSQSTSSGTLTVTRGAQSVKLTLLGQFAASSFVLSSNGHGGADITFAFAQAPAALARPSG